MLVVSWLGAWLAAADTNLLMLASRVQRSGQCCGCGRVEVCVRCHAAPSERWLQRSASRKWHRYLHNYTSMGGLTAEVGAGMLIGQLYWAAWQDGHKAFPAGVGTNVGLGGHILGGHRPTPPCRADAAHACHCPHSSCSEHIMPGASMKLSIHDAKAHCTASHFQLCRALGLHAEAECPPLSHASCGMTCRLRQVIAPASDPTPTASIQPMVTCHVQGEPGGFWPGRTAWAVTISKQ